MLEELALGRPVSLMSETSAEDVVADLTKRTARSESVNLEGLSVNSMAVNFNFNVENKPKRILRCGSSYAYVPPKISEFIIEKSEKHFKL